MKKIYVVIGLGFGDEGKGLATDFLCSNAEDPLVIRFNGGHQAGHTVVTSSRKRHTFSSFGSGTLRSVNTYWSKYCTFSPSMTLIEYAQLKALELKPSLLIDGECPVTTHYDILYNRLLETSRGIEKNGSCGLGFGATIKRNLDSLSFLVKDVVSLDSVDQKLNLIREYYKQKIDQETNFKFSQFDHKAEDEKFTTYIKGINTLIDKGIFEIVQEESVLTDDKWKTLIFEGAQGILLDMDYGNYPHVTFSNTTSKNAINIVSKYYNDNIYKNVLYVTRAYQTRHGAGPFKENELELINIEGETNVYNEFQGSLRSGYLNIDLIEYAIKCDDNFSQNYSKSILITCVDQLKDGHVYYSIKDETNKCVYHEIPNLIGFSFYKKYFSFGPTSEDVIKFN